MTIPFVDVKCRSPKIRQEISAAVEQAIDDGQYILGDQVAAFEHAFAGFSGGRHGIGLGNGTEALHLTLRALGVGPGDEVITAANTFVATALAIAYTGAKPVLVDADPNDYLIDVDLIEQAITPLTKAIVPVHLYGQPADMPAILEIAAKHDLPVVQDACQAHGALIHGTPLAAFGTAACYSFYPSKNLGAYGDGGMVVTNSDTLAERIRMLRNYGQRSKNKYEMLGFNSRLDTMQAAILSVKLRYLAEGNEQRRAAAERYRQALARRTDFVLPTERAGVKHVYHLFVVQHPQRDELAAHLQDNGVQCGIHYPTPIHQIVSFESSRTLPEGAPVATQLAGRILSLPMFPELADEQIDRVAQVLAAFDAKFAVA
ncbi:MAG TPA: DegT/DnrJ/EryC1/StrS family aminotransferase [Lacipirellulaceae bacterium]|nr:DegT/DnrJ/EryC1/StrS family aminotransferase [Lacipirellulaceae bacterium]